MSSSFFIIPYLIVRLYSFSGSSTTYYVSPAGNDEASGTSITTAWKSLDRINKQRLEKGDKVLLKAGSVFQGTILLDEKDGGDPSLPVLISSYGAGKAFIEAGEKGGIIVYNTGGVQIKSLVITGDGVDKNNASGIECISEKPSSKLSGITIEQCDISGFHDYGILIKSDKQSDAGFSKVKIMNCLTYANGEAGIGSLAVFPAISHSDFYVGYCKATGNRGIIAKTDNHSGNGIVLSGIDKLTIEYCEASENGADCRSVSGGPVGIWLWNCRNGIIQNSISHHNHAGTSVHDGGGFDLDGGCSNSTIQKCLSYNNEGAGYLLCEFGSMNPFTNNKVLDNTSVNDGLNNSYGGITVSGAGKEFPVTNTLIRNNKVVVENSKTVKGLPSALFLQGSDFKDIRFEANEFIVSGGAAVLRCDTLFNSNQAIFDENRFIVKDKGFRVDCSACGVQTEEFWKLMLQSKTKRQ